VIFLDIFYPPNYIWKGFLGIADLTPFPHVLINLFVYLSFLSFLNSKMFLPISCHEWRPTDNYILLTYPSRLLAVCVVIRSGWNSFSHRCWQK